RPPCSLTTIRTHVSYTHTSPPGTYTLSLHDALPISNGAKGSHCYVWKNAIRPYLKSLDVLACPSNPYGKPQPGLYSDTRARPDRSEEHTSELQSPYDLVCRLLLEKKKK